jgi:uncharacterized cupin superfamily protein
MDTTQDTTQRTTVALGSAAPERLEPFHGFAEVLEGDPAAGVAWLRTAGSAGAVLYAGIFEVQPSRFRYDFSADECVHVIAGEVEITVGDESPVRLGPGDLAAFAAGTTSTWHVLAPLRKFFVISG